MPPPTQQQQNVDWKTVLEALQRQGASAAAAQVDWNKVDWSSLAASDVGVRVGKPMTAEEFAAYRAKRKGGVHVIRHPQGQQDPGDDDAPKKSSDKGSSLKSTKNS